MKRIHKHFLIIGLIVITCCWALLAFLIKEETIQRVSMFGSLVFGTGSLMASIIALIVSVDANRKAELLRTQQIQDDAKKFIIDNNEELSYIPLCLIANAYNKHHKYQRDIYNSFNKLSSELQKEVLSQLNYDYEPINNNNWIDCGVKAVQKFYQENDLGSDFLYDGGKYFYRAMEKYSHQDYSTECELSHFMPDYFSWNPKIFFKDNKTYQENITFDSYLRSYLFAKKHDRVIYQIHKNNKPLDLLIDFQDLRNCNEDYVCYWMMQVVESGCGQLESQFERNDDFIFMTKGDAIIERFEDRFLDVLMELYNLNRLQNVLIQTKDGKPSI